MLMSHIYETTQPEKKNWKENEDQAKYFELLNTYKDQILIQVTGHDHLADFRTHSSSVLFNKQLECLDNQQPNEVDYFLGKMISPSVTPGRNSQPGYTTFVFNGSHISDVFMTFF